MTYVFLYKSNIINGNLLYILDSDFFFMSQETRIYSRLCKANFN